ncbi:MAG: hypothetical protein JWP51_5090 [Bradyrhizobium sp.]|nr:hypothetical protein [Bradyrhizobium sp.]
MLNQRPNDFHLAATSGENLVATHGDAGCTLIRLAQGTHRRFAHREYQPADVEPVDRRRTHRTGLPARIDRSPAERLPGHCGRRCTKRLHFRMSSPVSRIMGSNGPRFRYDLSLAVAYDSTEWPPATASSASAMARRRSSLSCCSDMIPPGVPLALMRRERAVLHRKFL